MNTQTPKPTSNLAGKFLLAMPMMGDPRFHKAVIYIFSHDKSGAMGFVMNTPLPGMQFKHLLKELDIEDENKVPRDIASIPLYNGGPIDTGRGFLIHGDDFKQSQTTTIDRTIYITATIDALKSLAADQGPKDTLLVFGYAGWTAGQLDEELMQNTWLIGEGDADFVFNTPHDQKWDKAMRLIGIDPVMLIGESGNA